MREETVRRENAYLALAACILALERTVDEASVDDGDECVTFDVGRE